MDWTDLLDRPIAFHRPLAQLAGSLPAGIMLSQAMYWTKRTSDQDGWFWKTQQQWEEETCMGRREQETARAQLRQLKLDGESVWEERLQGVPAKLHYRVNLDVLGEMLLNQHGGKRQTSMAESAKLEWRNPPNRHGGKRQTIYTENTTENTSQIFSDKRAPRVSGKKRGVSFDSFDYKTLAELFDQGTHEWLVRNCPTVSVEAASTAFLDYHRTRGTSFRSARAILSAWRGWMVKAEERGAGGARKGTDQILSEAELESLRRMGVEV